MYDDHRILNRINLQIPRNQTIAIVGESGSGKTTLINVLTGLLKPNEGRLLIDGSNLQDFNIETFQQHIGYITQEPVIFNDTIFQ